jgi:hypothetical protein
MTVRGGVRDKNGGTTLYTAQQVVQNVAPTVTITSASPQTISAGGSFAIDVRFTDPGTADRPWTITLIWGNGTQSANVTTQGVTVRRNRVYNQPGNYQVRVTVRDKDSGVGTSNTLNLTVN